MADFELVMPRMGESILEATVLRWLKKEGDIIEEDETILEIATDKVDSEVPSPVEGILGKILYQEGASVAVGETIAIIKTQSSLAQEIFEGEKDFGSMAPSEKDQSVVEEEYFAPSPISTLNPKKMGFLSPLVRNIARSEQISTDELMGLEGTGLQGKLTKQDLLTYLSKRKQTHEVPKPNGQKKQKNIVAKNLPPDTAPDKMEKKEAQKTEQPQILSSGNDEIKEMSRMRKLIANHMIHSRETSVHVTSYVEADVTNMWDWRQQQKDQFKVQTGTKLTFMPMIIQAVVRAIREFPQINCSIVEDKIIYKKNINIGIATALANGNLIVPVVKNADHYNIVGLAEKLDKLTGDARNNSLSPADISGGTFTISNIGTFGNIMGTPIINQPEVAILAVGAIRKLPAVVETKFGDLIAIRKKMFLSLSYDHRIIDGMLGGSFLKKIADNLEGFDQQRTI